MDTYKPLETMVTSKSLFLLDNVFTIFVKLFPSNILSLTQPVDYSSIESLTYFKDNDKPDKSYHANKKKLWVKVCLLQVYSLSMSYLFVTSWKALAHKTKKFLFWPDIPVEHQEMSVRVKKENH